ncbi:MAG: phosphoglycerol geranylgeranyltransferase [Euryarchaeota archaeon]|nr:phosphoglycerol geranylgeranyltransferase [Euryarchaeota archaeon]
MLPEQDLLDYILDETYTSRHILLIDPANQSPEIAAQRCIIAVEEGTRMIFVGGSTNTPNEVVHQTCLSIQEALELRVFACSQNPEMDESFWQVPVVLFPGGSHALSPAADAITFMMLMNSQSRKWLVGEQMKGAPVLHQYGIQTLPTAYLVCSPGGKVGEVGEAKLIEQTDIEIVKQYALTASMYGMKLIYLEAGSGAQKPVHTDLIHAAKISNLCMIVGGGIRNANQAAAAKGAGAKWIVTGTVTENQEDEGGLRMKLREIISEISD